jgi:hypothetical protein
VPSRPARRCARHHHRRRRRRVALLPVRLGRSVARRLPLRAGSAPTHGPSAGERGVQVPDPRPAVAPVLGRLRGNYT